MIHHDYAGPGVFADAVRDHDAFEWRPHETAPPRADQFDAAIVFGAAAQVDEEDIHRWLPDEKALISDLLVSEVPVLGICFGSQLLAEAAGAVLRPAATPEVGWHEVALTPDGRRDPLLGFCPERFQGIHGHSYEWLLPPGGVTLARSEHALQAFRLENRAAWGLQFHPEVTESDYNLWLDRWGRDPASVTAELDPEPVRAETAIRIGAWNEIGRGIARRFLAVAASSRRPAAPDSG